MRLQENLKLLEKRNASMMFFLSLDVTMNLGELRLTHCERAISFLPLEVRATLERSRNPARGIRLQLADKFRDRLVLPQFRQDVDMIGCSIDDHRDSFFVANRAAEILMRPRADFQRQPGFASFCREDDVIQQIAIGGTHSEGDFRRPFSGAFVVRDNTPGVPLRSTPGSNSGAPSGCFMGRPRMTDGRWQMALAPEARRNTARSGAQRNSGDRSTKISNPCQGVAELRVIQAST